LARINSFNGTDSGLSQVAGGALSTFHYVALTGGLEIRYGRRLINWPWHNRRADGH
jgi:hypothetical protein